MPSPTKPATKELYEWREYEFNFNSPRGEVEKYFKNALIPAFNKLGIKTVGVFTEMGKSDPAKVHMLIPYASFEDFKSINEKIKDEFDIFYRTGLNPVFFGEVIAGGNLPRLTYMITFKNMEEHDKNWAKFSADEVWKKISKAPEYANTVSKIYKTFMEPTAYSQL